MLKPGRDRQRLTWAWSRLPARDRLILTLLYFEGLSPVEAARAAGCSVRDVERTVELRLTGFSRALARAAVRTESRRAA